MAARGGPAPSLTGAPGLRWPRAGTATFPRGDRDLSPRRPRRPPRAGPFTPGRPARRRVKRTKRPFRSVPPKVTGAGRRDSPSFGRPFGRVVALGCGRIPSPHLTSSCRTALQFRQMAHFWAALPPRAGVPRPARPPQPAPRGSAKPCFCGKRPALSRAGAGRSGGRITIPGARPGRGRRLPRDRTPAITVKSPRLFLPFYLLQLIRVLLPFSV